MVSIIIPTFNEKDNVKDLLVTIHQAFAGNSEAYEVIVIDDYSTDGTWELLNGEKPKYPLRIFKKDGPKGKAYSLFQGFNQSNGEYLVMIDADLQYPPEAIPEMISKLKTYDVVVANRKHYMSSLPRKVLSKCFNFLFSRMLHGIKSDAQSGLKAFRRTVLTTIQFTPKSPWTFDLEFLIRAKEAGFTICNQDINFYRRKNGKSKINTISASFEIGINALTIKIKKFEPQHIPAKQANSMLGAGIGYKRKKYITHTTLPHQQSAIKGLSIWQKTTILGILTVVSLGLFINTLTTAIIITAIISIIYFLDLLFNMFLIFKTLHSPAEITFDREKLGLIQNEHLPVYSILCPLYKEANVLPHFLSAIDKLDWPKDKLDVILLLEADDKESIEKVSQIQMPFYVRVLIVPDSQPKTKPKACNFGLAHARGEYLVIYDAEDIPDPLQLKKAYTAFQQVSENVFCLQAKLNYHNT
ncbi:MAG TPA: glycosyltransferase, partial [Candidatus Dojkabacteria bacterium]|nr:glycosyltransferase [Candidatus Dojkabacteria bacterium]